MYTQARQCSRACGIPRNRHKARLEGPARKSLFQVKECKRLIYKRACQEHFSASAGGAGLVRDIQPLSP
jgi:hypothetical protein